MSKSSPRRRARRMANSVAYASLSDDAKKMLASLYDKCGGDSTKTTRVEFEPGHWIDVRLSEKWRDFGEPPSECPTEPSHLDHGRMSVPLASRHLSGGTDKSGRLH